LILKDGNSQISHFQSFRSVSEPLVAFPADRRRESCMDAMSSVSQNSVITRQNGAEEIMLVFQYFAGTASLARLDRQFVFGR